MKIKKYLKASLKKPEKYAFPKEEINPNLTLVGAFGAALRLFFSQRTQRNAKAAKEEKEKGRKGFCK